jgi:ubiquinone/menaquinone biosynthesis C-methylase UbiE
LSHRRLRPVKAYTNAMGIPFGSLGPLFRLFSARLYPDGAKRRISAFIRQVSSSAPVVDLGGGTGVLIDIARSARPDLTYVCADPALGMLRYARSNTLPVAARGEELPFKDGTLTAVMIGDAFHHFTDLERAMAEVHRTLEAGGRLFIFDISPKTFAGHLIAGLERLLGEPGNFLSPDCLRETLTEKGFTLHNTAGGWAYTVEAVK